jgi:acyl dehydratase
MPKNLTLGDLVVQPDAPLATSDWVEVTQERIAQFADATGDHQWIHVDPDRAKRESPFRATVAHGFLTLSLISQMALDSFQMAGVRLVVNYGVNRVRFTAPVPAGARVRGRFAVAGLEPFDSGVQIIWHVTIDLEGSDKPCCIAEWVVRYYTGGLSLSDGRASTPEDSKA